MKIDSIRRRDMSDRLPRTTGSTTSGENRLGNGKLQHGSPLHQFTQAKSGVGYVYKKLEAYICDLNELLSQAKENHQDVVSDKTVEEVGRFHDAVLTIKETFQRDHMKVVFFGRTSNGKSTVINAMLHAKVLPQGLGHTTCCFIQVEASPDDQCYLTNEDSHERFEISSLSKVAHAGRSDRESDCTDKLIRVHVPKKESKLLQNDVVLVDSPGVDLSPEYDSWIDKHCLDADVFVLVCNAESTLTQSEKSFFARVSSKLSKPNVFILNNRWDASASEPDSKEVHEMHMRRFRQFLVNELEVCDDNEVVNRVFFISAREVLTERLKDRGIPGTPIDELLEGRRVRSMEFSNYEKKFEMCISKTAIKTKFDGHVRRGMDMLKEMLGQPEKDGILERIHREATSKRQNLLRTKTEREGELRQSGESFVQFERKWLDEKERLKAEVSLQVSADIYDVVRRLDLIIDRFDRKKFKDDPVYLHKYKQELTVFVDEAVTKELEIRCTGGLLQRIINAEKNMIADVSGLVPEKETGKVVQMLQYRQPFYFSIKVNCQTLAEDFHEDLQFCFSFGLSALIRRYVAYRSGRPITAFGDSSTRNLMFGSCNSVFPSRLSGYEREKRMSEYGQQEQQQLQEERGRGKISALIAPVSSDEAVINSIVLTTAQYVANGGVGLLLVTGLVYRTVGWRLLAVGAAAYLGLYALERLRWNSHAKEQHFKRQLRSHLACRLKQLSNSHTAQCEEQASRELEEVLKCLRATVVDVHRNMKTDMEEQVRDLKALDSFLLELQKAKGDGILLKTDFENFKKNYLDAVTS